MTKRRQNDFYPTPSWATEELIRRVPIYGGILECCSGEGAIADVLETMSNVKVWCNDIVTGRPKQTHQFNAALAVHWAGLDIHPAWVVTNPPFNQAAQIVPLAYENAATGIAMLLRLSYLEPVEDRGSWLNEHPPTELIVLPRISFTGDGKTDSVTCAWMVWQKHHVRQKIVIAENPRFSQKEWRCESCERVLDPSLLTRVGIGIHHYDPDKDHNHDGLLNCGLVTQRQIQATASSASEGLFREVTA